MASHRRAVLIVGLAVVAAACTSSSSDPEPTSSPATAAPTTSQAPPPSTTAAPPPPTTTQPPTAGTLTATLQVGGEPLAGVEVWLGVTRPGMASEARYACSDEDGVVEFEMVPFDASLMSITGPGTAGECPNPLFLDTSASPAYPLSPTTLLTANSSLSRDRDLGVVAVPRLPGSTAIARASVAFYVSCFRDGDIEEARRLLEGYEQTLAAEQNAGALSFRENQLILANTNGIRFLAEAPESCTQPMTIDHVPVIFDWVYTDEANRPQLTLLDPGAEPRRVLTFIPPEGTTADTTQRQVLTQTQEIDGEVVESTSTTVDVALSTEVVAVDEEGYIVTSTIRDVRVSASDAASQGQVQAALETLIGRLEASLVAPNGEILATESLGLEVFGLDSATSALAALLPAEPVGVGATWTVEARFDVLGVDATATTTYTVTGIDGDRLTVEIDTVHDIDAEALLETFGLEDAEVSLTQAGTGRAVWNLASAETVESAFDLEQLLTVTATFGGQESTLEQVTATSIRIPSPEPFPSL